MRVAKESSSGYLRTIIGIGIFTLLLIRHPMASGQVVSHELRKLAVASNQFGIDALRALDKIEPQDKVIVFNPVCLTSSLSMVMMGSSKYQVVSSLRQALYVWSMKPQEINRAFRDVFDHIGINQPALQQQQQQQHMVAPMKSPKNQTSRVVNQQESTWWQNAAATNEGELDGWESIKQKSVLSLPKLVKMREQHYQPWWAPLPTTTTMSRKNSEAKELRRQQSAIAAPVDFSQMNTLSSIYIQRGLLMNYNYNLLLRDYYKTVVHPVDFIRNGEETRQHINSLVASSTEGKVKDLMKRQSFEGKQLPKALIISTFHFRGTLDVQMKAKPSVPSNNNVREKRTIGGKEIQYIQTEPTLLKYGSFKRGLDCTCIEIPFSNRLISLIILMPNHANSTDLLLTKLSAQVLSDMLSSLSVRQISLEIPVIKFGRGPTNVSGLLRELSLNETFFGGLGSSFSTETGLNRWLRPEDIVHETSIDIGTSVLPQQQHLVQEQQSGASQTEDRLKVGAHNEAKKRGGKKVSEDRLKLDKPFFYFISDSINGLVLTMGRIRQ